MCPSPLNCHRPPLALSSSCSYQIVKHISKMLPSLFFSRLNNPRFLNIPFYERSSKPFISFTALHWTHSSTSAYLLQWEAQNRIINGSSPEERITFLDLLTTLLTFLAARTCQPAFQPVSPQAILVPWQYSCPGVGLVLSLCSTS